MFPILKHNQRSLLVPNLLAGKTYFFRVLTMHGGGNAPSVAVAAILPPDSGNYPITLLDLLIIVIAIGVASYGALEQVPPLDFQLVIFGDYSQKQIQKMQKNNAIFCAFFQFLAHFCHFFAHSFPQGVIIVPKMPERSPINFNSTCTSDSGKTGS